VAKVANSSSKGKKGVTVQPSKEASVLTQMFTRPDAVSPPDTPGKIPAQQSGQQPPPVQGSSMGPALIMIPMFRLLGHTLARISKEPSFELDEESAKYLGDMLCQAAQKHGVEVDPLWAFLGAMLTWLGGAAAMWAMNKYGEDDGTGEGLFGKLKSALTGNREAPKAVAPPQAPPVQAPQPPVVGIATATAPPPPPQVTSTLATQPGEKPWTPMALPSQMKDNRKATP
jgi:hypothetical protein